VTFHHSIPTFSTIAHTSVFGFASGIISNFWADTETEAKQQNREQEYQENTSSKQNTK
jgi:hypothetical protein